jgi:hypothetical protein
VGGLAGGSWKDVARRYAETVGGGFVAAEHGAVFYAYDTLAYPNQPVELAVKLLSARDLQPIGGVTVAISRGEWLTGRVATDANGLARLSGAFKTAKLSEVRKAYPNVAVGMVARPRLHVVTGWRQIEQGIFGGRSYPAPAFAQALEDHARRLEAEQRDRENRDDDEDD